MTNFLSKSKSAFREYKTHTSDLLEIRKAIRTNTLSTDENIQLIKQYSEFRPSQKDTEIRLLMDLIQKNKSRVILEIGGYRGGSLFLLAQSSPIPSTIISVDICYSFQRRIAHKFFARPGQRITCIKGDTKKHSTLQKVKRALSGNQIDFLFIDGDHSFSGVMNDFVLYSPLVRSGGIIAFHDINPDSWLKFGIKTSSYVGEVPIFWKALISTGVKFDEYIEQDTQDGYGLGFIYV